MIVHTYIVKASTDPFAKNERQKMKIAEGKTECLEAGCPDSMTHNTKFSSDTSQARKSL